jgi:hypothetical protein
VSAGCGGGGGDNRVAAAMLGAALDESDVEGALSTLHELS